MANYHLAMQRVSRSTGRSVIAAAAYRAGVDLHDEYTGEVHKYAHRQASGDIGECLLVLPSGTQPDREAFWNAVEKHHKRRDANLAWEWEVSLPVELSHEQNASLVQTYAIAIAKEYGVAADICIHRSHDGKNPQAHILLSACSVADDDQLGKKCVWLDPIHCERNRIQNPAHTERERWADLQNAALKEAGHEVRVDHRSLEAQGIDREPQRHAGKYNSLDVWAETAAYNNQIERDAAEKAALLAEEAAITARLKDLYRQLREEGVRIANEATLRAEIDKMQGLEIVARNTLNDALLAVDSVDARRYAIELQYPDMSVPMPNYVDRDNRDAAKAALKKKAQEETDNRNRLSAVEVSKTKAWLVLVERLRELGAEPRTLGILDTLKKVAGKADWQEKLEIAATRLPIAEQRVQEHLQYHADIKKLEEDTKQKDQQYKEYWAEKNAGWVREENERTLARDTPKPEPKTSPPRELNEPKAKPDDSPGLDF